MFSAASRRRSRLVCAVLQQFTGSSNPAILVSQAQVRDLAGTGCLASANLVELAKTIFADGTAIAVDRRMCAQNDRTVLRYSRRIAVRKVFRTLACSSENFAQPLLMNPNTRLGSVRVVNPKCWNQIQAVGVPLHFVDHSIGASSTTIMLTNTELPPTVSVTR